jgi:hypothetical protein
MNRPSAANLVPLFAINCAISLAAFLYQGRRDASGKDAEAMATRAINSAAKYEQKFLWRLSGKAFFASRMVDLIDGRTLLRFYRRFARTRSRTLLFGWPLATSISRQKNIRRGRKCLRTRSPVTGEVPCHGLDLGNIHLAKGDISRALEKYVKGLPYCPNDPELMDTLLLTISGTCV